MAPPHLILFCLLALPSFFLTVHSANLCLLLAAPLGSDITLSSVAGDNKISIRKMRQVSFGVVPREDILMNNIHALVKDDDILGVKWPVKDTDTIYAWRTMDEDIDQIVVEEKRRDVPEGEAKRRTVGVVVSTKSTAERFYVYLLHWVDGSMTHRKISGSFFLSRFKYNESPPALRRHWELLYSWIERSTHEDPWTSSSNDVNVMIEAKNRNDEALRVEGNRALASRKEVASSWEALLEKCRKDAIGNMVVALNALQSWLNDELLVRKVAWALTCTRDEFNIRWGQPNVKYDSPDVVNSIKLRRLELEGLWRNNEYGFARKRLFGMDLMWEVLYEAHTTMATLDQSVQSLNDTGRVAYETLETLAVVMSSAEAHAVVDKIVVEARGDLSSDATMKKFHDLFKKSSKRAENTLDEHRTKMLKVFGDCHEIKAGCPDECNGLSNDHVARKMVNAVRRMGWNNLSDTVETINKLRLLRVELERIGSMADLKRRLQSRNLDFSPYALQSYTDLIRKYPQMSFYYKLDPKHLDVLLPLHFLLMTALKGSFAAPDYKQPPSWKLVTPDEACFGEDATKPAFAAYKNLLGIPMPEFVLDHWKQTLKEQAATPMDTTPP
eukprot:GHVS01050003.1.p1 GENE.GHVS01050003.1~~GHVS01050003.1.p1  ORF type:complete len:611 (-),score=50.81 GHVS01050003.1:348-2180(-)